MPAHHYSGRHEAIQRGRQLITATRRHRALTIMLTCGFIVGAAPTAFSAAPLSSNPRQAATTSGEAQRLDPLPAMPGGPASHPIRVQRVLQGAAQQQARHRADAEAGMGHSVRLGADVARASVAPQWLVPMKGYRLTSRFGPRWGRLHKGVDLAASIGGSVAALTSGGVTFAGRQQGYGNLVVITHADGAESHYAHLDAINVAQDQRVVPGQPIGKSGNSGNSTGPHLHLEIRIDGEPIDPMPYLAERGVRLADHSG